MRTIAITDTTGHTDIVHAHGAARATLLTTPWNGGPAKLTRFVRFGRELWRKRPGVRLSQDDALIDPRRHLSAWCRFQVLDGESAADALARFHTTAATEADSMWPINGLGEDWVS